MARTYNGSSERTTFSFSAPSVAPWSLYIRGNPSAVTANCAALNMTALAAADSNHLLFFRGDLAGDFAQFRTANGSTQVTCVGAGLSAGTWYDISGQLSGGTNIPALHLDAVATSGGGNSYPGPNTPDTIVIGAYGASSAYASYWPGALCSAAAWSDILSLAEYESLDRGFPPRRVRPQSLLFYLPMVRASFNWRDLGGTPTDTGSPSASDHPRSYGF